MIGISDRNKQNKKLTISDQNKTNSLKTRILTFGYFTVCHWLNRQSIPWNNWKWNKTQLFLISKDTLRFLEKRSLACCFRLGLLRFWSVCVWCLDRVCRPCCWFVSNKPSFVPKNSIQYADWLLSWNKSLWCTLFTFKLQLRGEPRLLKQGTQEPQSFWPAACWRVTRYHFARSASSNRDRFAYYNLFLLYIFAGGDRCLLGFGFWAKHCGSKNL